MNHIQSPYGRFFLGVMAACFLLAGLLFAAAAGVLKHSIEGDFNLSSVEDIERLVRFGGNGRTAR